MEFNVGDMLGGYLVLVIARIFTVEVMLARKWEVTFPT
jgi:hypothetical protein